jgi:signal transduction histidine kinase
MTESDETALQTGKSPRGFIALSRQLLRHASQGTPRLEFLRKVSDAVLQFSGCDWLEFWVYGDARYRWRASRSPAESGVIELPPDIAGWQNLGRQEEGCGGKLAADILGIHFEPSAPCFTSHGSFWTGNLSETVARHGIRHNGQVTTQPDTQSLALFPFVISEGNGGVLRLEAAQPQSFDAQTIEFYEAAVETLGLAIADRRAHAALRERIKELECLYGIARIVEHRHGELADSLAQIVRLLPPAWQFTDIAEARIVLDDVTVSTGEVDGLCVRQSAPIDVRGQPRGHVEVGYVSDPPDIGTSPFLQEEELLIAAVARAIGQFVDRHEAERQQLQLQEQLRHADRLATVGQLTAGIAHEINEPLSSILGYAQLAQKAGNLAETTANDLSKIVGASLQARDIVNKLKTFARQAPIQKVWISVGDVVGEALSLVESRCVDQQVELVQRVVGELREVYLDPGQLKQVVVNLAVNALQAMPDGGTLTVTLGRDDRSAVVEVQDTGMGMTQETVQQIFDPFFTTKDVGEGTGLGLCVVQGIVTAHGGTISVESEEGKGAKFTVRLPFSATADETPKEHDLE